MGIKEFANETKMRGIKLTQSEKEELDNKVNEIYEKFRELDVYRIYDTYYKDNSAALSAPLIFTVSSDVTYIELGVL